MAESNQNTHETSSLHKSQKPNGIATRATSNEPEQLLSALEQREEKEINRKEEIHFC